MKKKKINYSAPKMSAKKLILIFYLVNFSTGCVLNDFTLGTDSSRPKSWPIASYDETKNCPDISGTYNNLGKYIGNLSPSEQDKNLWHSLTGIFENVSFNEKIKIHPISESHLVFDFLSGGTLINRKSLEIKAGDFECKEGRILLRSTIISAADGTGGYRNKLTLKLERANDGSLVGEKHLTGVGALLWAIPVVGGQSTWFRWMPAG